VTRKLSNVFVRFRAPLHALWYVISFTNGGAAGSSLNWWYGAGKNQEYHDAWNEYALVYLKRQKIQFDYGGGLHYYMGLSRATMASTLNF
jgi:hypothetical protein